MPGILGFALLVSACLGQAGVSKKAPGGGGFALKAVEKSRFEAGVDIFVLACGSAGKVLAVMDFDAKDSFEVWEIGTAKKLWSGNGASYLALSPDERTLVASMRQHDFGKQPKTHAFDAQTGKELFAVPTGVVFGAAFHPNGQTFALSVGCGVQLRNTKDGAIDLGVLLEVPSRMAFSKNGEFCATVCGKEIEVFDIRTARRQPRITPEFARIVGLALSPDAKTLAIASRTPVLAKQSKDKQSKGMVELRDLPSGNARFKIEAKCSSICLSPDGKWMAFNDVGRKVISIRDAGTGKEACTIAIEKMFGGNLAFPTNDTLIFAYERVVRVFKLSLANK